MTPLSQCIDYIMGQLAIPTAERGTYLQSASKSAVQAGVSLHAYVNAVVATLNDKTKRKYELVLEDNLKAMVKQEKKSKTHSGPRTPVTRIPVTPPREYAWKASATALTPRSISQIIPAKMKQPRVFYTPETRAIIDYLVNSCAQEVGWLGLVEKQGDDYLIGQIYVPEQTVNATETDIGSDAFTALVEEIFSGGHNPGHLYYWGHSHVNMAVSPSHQDEQQVQEYLESCPVFIRGIYNKRGDSKVDVYDREARVVFQCVEERTRFELAPEMIQGLDELIKTNVKSSRVSYITSACNVIDYEDAYDLYDYTFGGLGYGGNI